LELPVCPILSFAESKPDEERVMPVIRSTPANLATLVSSKHVHKSWLSWICGLFFVSIFVFCAQTVRAAQDSPASRQKSIAVLIEQLGNDDFTTREVAQGKLFEHGLYAFDQLHAAQHHDDIEISKRAIFLIGSIYIPWTVRTDGPEVRAILSGYATKNSEDRKSHMQRLAALDDYLGIAALSRMVRYESSNRLSRFAALLIMNQAVPADVARTKDLVAELEGLHRESSRVGALWVQVYALSLQSPQESVDAWDKVTRDEEVLLATFPNQSSRTLLRNLLRWQFQLLLGLGDKEAARHVARRSVNLLDGSREQLIEAIDWFASQKSWAYAGLIEERFPIEFGELPELLYRLAEAHLHAGNQELADKAVRRAVVIKPEDIVAHTTMALWLTKHHFYDWAIAEYQQCTEQATVESDMGVRVRIILAELFHDLTRDSEAAAALSEVIKHRDNNAVDMAVKRYYPSFAAFESRYIYYQASAAAKREDFSQQKLLLEKALSLDRYDGDVLIAAFKYALADDQWRQDTLANIAAAAEHYVKEVDQLVKKRDTTLDRTAKARMGYELARAYNQYAWVVGNTVGDFEQAIKFSRESLNLRGWELPGYLDTLGHAYYGARKFEEAVLWQSKAVELDPASQAMSRQLKVFQTALEKQTVNDRQ
jgi:tetratricopeptide (TPR) repeat protein